MSEQDYEQLTLFPADSPASRFPQPGSVEARRMTVTSGLRCSELSKKSGPLGSLERTLLESSTWHSTRSFLTWKFKATKQGRLYFQLVVSTPRTAGNGSQSWPTPTARDYRTANSMEHLLRGQKQNHEKQLNNAVKLWPTPVSSDWRRRGPNSHQQGLPEAVRLWPTPRASKIGGYSSPDHRPTLEQAVKQDQGLWPTPTARSGKQPSQTASRQGGSDLQTAAAMFPTPTTGAGLCGGTGNYNQLKALERAGEITEEERRNMAAGNGGQLNPDWVEALMGFPPGWTALEPDGQTEPGRPESRD